MFLDTFTIAELHNLNAMIRLLLLSLTMLCAGVFGHVEAQTINLEDIEEIAIIEQKVMMPMRDGIRLSTDIYRPKTDKPVPVIFERTPYNFNAYRDGKLSTRKFKKIHDVVSRGYAFVIQNERGRYYSEGEWDILGVPLTDGYDAFTWMTDQPWCNGKIGTLGCSSTAEWQMGVASLDHPFTCSSCSYGLWRRRWKNRRILRARELVQRGRTATSIYQLAIMGPTRSLSSKASSRDETRGSFTDSAIL